MTAPPAVSDDVKAAVLAALDSGETTLAEAAKVAGVSRMTVSRWRKAARTAPPDAPPYAGFAPPLPPAPPVDERPPPEPMPDVSDPIAFMRRMLSDAMKRASENAATGNNQQATREAKVATDMAAILARLEKGAIEERDVLRLSRPEIAEAMAGVLARVQIMLSRGQLLCAECSRALSVSWGAEKSAPDAALDADAQNKLGSKP